MWKILAFLIHFAACICLIAWHQKNINDDAPPMRLNQVYYRETVIDSREEEIRYPVIVPMGDEAYTFNDMYEEVFDKQTMDGNCNETKEEGACAMQGVMPTMEIQYLKQDYTLGSANDTVFLLLLFEWITASFALEYVIEGLWPAHKHRKLGYPIGAFVIIWNIILLIYYAVQVTEIPWNNVALASILLGFTIVRQILQYACSGSNWITEIYLATTSDNDMNTTVTRYFEYAITAPVLLLAVQAETTQSEGWSYAVAYICMLVTNILGMAMHKVAERSENGETDILLLVALTPSFYVTLC